MAHQAGSASPDRRAPWRLPAAPSHPTPREECFAILDAAVDAGINLIDTSNSYAKGEAERVIGAWLAARGKRDRVLIATKVFYPTGPGMNDRVLIKVAATWEGIQAAARLEKRGIHTNLTLLFSFCQAVACGQAKVQLISPFVGRIYDWYKKSAGAAWVEADNAGVNDPGVKSVRQIYNHYKKWGIATEVMGASFRNVGQITALAGCDLLTISPDLLAILAATEAPLSQALNAGAAQSLDLPAVNFDEAQFRFALNEDAMATEKLAEGIRAFCVDAVKLEQLLLAA